MLNGHGEGDVPFVERPDDWLPYAKHIARTMRVPVLMLEDAAHEGVARMMSHGLPKIDPSWDDRRVRGLLGAHIKHGINLWYRSQASILSGVVWEILRNPNRPSTPETKKAFEQACIGRQGLTFDLLREHNVIHKHVLSFDRMSCLIGAIHEAIQDITHPRRKQVMAMRFIQGLIVSDIMSKLEISKSTVERDLRMGIAEIRDRLIQEYEA